MASMLGDIGGILGANITAKNSTSRKGNTDLNMQDFLQLMIVQLQSQSLDDSMDTSEMMNQLVQMQMISAITNMTEVNVQSYANSLVNQIVTVGIVTGNNTLEERVIQVYGTGTYNGEQVIFGSDGNMYYLKQIMAVGVMPDKNGKYPQLQGSGSSDSTNPTDPADPTNPSDPNNPGDVTSSEKGDNKEPSGGTNNTDPDNTITP